MVIGKVMVLTFSDSEEYVFNKIKEAVEKENTLEYIEEISEPVLSFQDLRIHLKEQTVYRNGEQIFFSHKEFLAFQFLTEHPGWVCTKKQLYGVVEEEELTKQIDNMIYCLIRSLRKKLETDPRHPEYIQTVRNVGYKFVIPEK